MYLENEKNVFIFVTLLQIEFKHMGQNMFLFFVLNCPNRVVKHWGMKKNINFRCSFKIPINRGPCQDFGTVVTVSNRLSIFVLF